MWAVKYMCVRGLCFFDFLIFWSCWDSVVFFFFHFITRFPTFNLSRFFQTGSLRSNQAYHWTFVAACCSIDCFLLLWLNVSRVFLLTIWNVMLIVYTSFSVVFYICLLWKKTKVTSEGLFTFFKRSLLSNG